MVNIINKAVERAQSSNKTKKNESTTPSTPPDVSKDDWGMSAGDALKACIIESYK